MGRDRDALFIAILEQQRYLIRRFGKQHYLGGGAIDVVPVGGEFEVDILGGCVWLKNTFFGQDRLEKGNVAFVNLESTNVNVIICTNFGMVNAWVFVLPV